MPRSTTALSTLVLLLVSAGASAQLEHGGRPPSALRAARLPTPTARMRPVLAGQLLAEDAASGRHDVLRFGEALEVDLGLANAGRWEELGRGARVWRLRIESPGAKSLALIFARFQLPSGAELFVYDDARSTVLGAFTQLENRPDGQFAIRPVRGEALTLEYYEPGRVRGQGELELATVTHDYRDVLSLLEPKDRAGGGVAQPCMIDVACPQGAGWQNAIDATVQVMSLQGLLCSGVLLNNTANDGTVLVLSAAHCQGLATSTFTFNFQRSSCGGSALAGDSITGATQLVSDDVLDVQLARLDLPQGPLGFPAYLAGWDRSDVPPASTVLIHHPAGDVKKISRDDDPPEKSGGFWRILDWEDGASQGGSSGGPLFDPAGRFIGNLDSGSSSCTSPTNDDFATRLAFAWPELAPYLDPLGTGQLTLDGLDTATVTPQPLAITAVEPSTVPSLEVGLRRTVRILGAGLDDAATIDLDAQPLDPERYVRGGHSWLSIDMPQLALGAHEFTVHDGGTSVTLPFTVVPPAEPLLQVNEGVIGQDIFSALGVTTYHADTPGHVHYCYWSLSGVPSNHPLLHLGIGNGFSDLRGCWITPIPAEGWVAVDQRVRRRMLPVGTRVYTQSACINHGLPLHVTNVQEGVFQQ